MEHTCVGFVLPPSSSSRLGTNPMTRKARVFVYSQCLMCNISAITVACCRLRDTDLPSPQSLWSLCSPFIVLLIPCPLRSGPPEPRGPAMGPQPLLCGGQAGPRCARGKHVLLSEVAPTRSLGNAILWTSASSPTQVST